MSNAQLCLRLLMMISCVVKTVHDDNKMLNSCLNIPSKALILSTFYLIALDMLNFYLSDIALMLFFSKRRQKLKSYCTDLSLIERLQLLVFKLL